jgi:ferredoxin
MDVIHIDLSLCVGHGKCYGIAPELMTPFDDEGHAEFHGEPIDPEDLKRVARGNIVIDSCPEQALSWRSVESG